MALFQSTAIILKAFNYGESDRIVTFLTPHHGKIKGFARGARKSQRRFGAALEIGSLVELEWKSARSELVSLQRATSLSPDPQWRHSIAGMAAVPVALEWVDAFVKEEQPAEEKFQLLVSFLQSWDESQTVAALVAFEMEVLKLAGFSLGMDHCLECHTTTPVGEWRFDSELGGILCAQCHQGRGVAVDIEPIYQKNPQILQGLLESCFCATIGKSLKSIDTFHALFS